MNAKELKRHGLFPGDDCRGGVCHSRNPRRTPSAAVRATIGRSRHRRGRSRLLAATEKSGDHAGYLLFTVIVVFSALVSLKFTRGRPLTKRRAIGVGASFLAVPFAMLVVVLLAQTDL